MGLPGILSLGISITPGSKSCPGLQLLSLWQESLDDASGKTSPDRVWMVNMCFFTVCRMSELAFQVLSHFMLSISILKVGEGFPGGSVVKNSLANARDTGSIPDAGRSHMPQSNSAWVPQPLSLCSRAREPQLLSSCATTTEAHAPSKRDHCRERLTHRN